MLLLNTYQHAALIHRTGSHITSLCYFYIQHRNYRRLLFFFLLSFFQGQKPGLTDVQAELDRMTRKPDSMVTANNTPATENEAWARQQHCPIWKSTCNDIKEKKKMLFMTKISPTLCINQQTDRKCWDSIRCIGSEVVGEREVDIWKDATAFLCFHFQTPFYVCLLFVVINFWCGMAGQVMGALSLRRQSNL